MMGNTDTPGFRLLTEPASLKQLGTAPVTTAVQEFPAPHRAGLIEAGRPPRSAFRPAGCFRLLTEPASLKRDGSGRRRERT